MGLRQASRRNPVKDLQQQESSNTKRPIERESRCVKDGEKEVIGGNEKLRPKPTVDYLTSCRMSIAWIYLLHG